jgi:ABC-type transport system involved in cytochrome bd biosynthesis fused ATPase/permease subunit
VALAVIVLLPLAAFEAVTGLPDAARAVYRVRQSTARLDEVFAAQPPVRPPSAPVVPPEGPFPLVVSNLHARWPGAPDEALRGVDLRLEPGRRIAVVGASGAGKSTLAATLLRFLDPSAGRITLAGVDVTTLEPDAVRRMIGWCAQDAHLFATSLLGNLLLARPEASEEELWAALERVRLTAWARSLPQELDTPVGTISGGQRQRLALARVLLADFPVVVLDEPAASIDPATADALTADLMAATADRATLLITHRLAGSEAADEVVVLGAGRVVQRGTPGALLSVDGPYRDWWRRERAADDRGAAPATVRMGDWNRVR